METKRTFHRFKWQWAEAKAAELRMEEDRWRSNHIPSSNWRAVRGKMTALGNISQERMKFERLAERFKAEGV
jgi:hypothetical protein